MAAKSGAPSRASFPPANARTRLRGKWFTLWVVLAIACPLACGWVSVFASGVVSEDLHQRRFVQWAESATILERASPSGPTVEDTDAAIQTLTNKHADIVVSTVLKHPVNGACVGCGDTLVWLSSADSLGPNSQLLSGRWPKHSREVLVSERAAHQGASTSGTVELTEVPSGQSSGSTETYTIVGVGRTTVNSGDVLYTSMVDERIRRADRSLMTGRPVMWILPVRQLSPSAWETLSAHNLRHVRVHQAVPAAVKWQHTLVAWLLGTCLVALLMSPWYFARRPVQSRGAALSAARQSLVIAGAAAIVVAGAAGLAAAYSLFLSPNPATSLGSGMLWAPTRYLGGTLAIAFVVVAISFTLAGCSHHWCRQAQGTQTGGTVRLSLWLAAGVVACGVGWPLLTAMAVARRSNSDSMPASNTLGIFVLFLAVVAVGVATSMTLLERIVAVVLTRVSPVLGRQRDLEFQRATATVFAARCGVAIICVQAFLVSFPQLTETDSYRSGHYEVDVPAASVTAADDLVAKVERSGQFPQVAAFPRYALDNPAHVGDRSAKTSVELYSGPCALTSGDAEPGSGSSTCFVQSGLLFRTHIMKTDDLIDVFDLSPNQVRAVQAGSAIYVPSSRDDQGIALGKQLTLATYDPAASDDKASRVGRVVNVKVEVAGLRGAPLSSGDASLLIPQETLEATGAETRVSGLLMRSTVALTKSQQETLQHLLTGHTGESLGRSRTYGALGLLPFVVLLGFVVSYGCRVTLCRLPSNMSDHSNLRKATGKWSLVVACVVGVSSLLVGTAVGGLLLVTAKLCTPLNFVAWQIPLWEPMLVLLMLPVVAALCGLAVLPRQGNEFPVATGHQSSAHRLQAVFGGTSVVACALFFLYIMAQFW